MIFPSNFLREPAALDRISRIFQNSQNCRLTGKNSQDLPNSGKSYQFCLKKHSEGGFFTLQNVIHGLARPDHAGI